MKLVMVTHYFDSHVGGIEFIASGLMRAIARLGHRVVWLASDTTRPPPAPQDCTCIALRSTNILENRFGLPIPIIAPSGAIQIFRQVRDTDAVLVHDLLYPANILAFAAARLWRKPFIVASHVGAVPYRSRWLRLIVALANKIVARPLLAQADGVAFFSGITARYFATVRFRAPPQFVFNGIDTEIFRPVSEIEQKAEIRGRWGLAPDRKVALFVGRFVEKKGLHLIRRMAQRRPDILWALAGWGLIDPESWKLPNVKVFSGLSGASLAPLYQASDVFVLPSVGEGFPLVIQEAIACGLPIVCGDETARADEAVKNFFVPVAMNRDNADAIAEDYCAAVDRIVAERAPGDATERSRVATERYSWAACADAHLALIERARAARAAPPRTMQFSTASLHPSTSLKKRPKDG